MPIIVVIVLIIIVCAYFLIRSQGKFTRGGDINKQGEGFDESPFPSDFTNIKKEVDDDPDTEVPEFTSKEELEEFYRKAKEKLDKKDSKE